MVVTAIAIFAFILGLIGVVLVMLGIIFFFIFKKRKLLGRILGFIFLFIGLIFCLPALFVVNAVKEGINKERMDKGPLLNAIDKNNYNEVNKLLDSGEFKLNIRYYGYVTPLTYAIQKEKYSITDLIIDKGADINLKDDLGFTPLITAVNASDYKMVKLLLDKGADINGKDDKEFTALITAAFQGKSEIVKLLLEHKADCNIIQFGSTALDYAIQHNDQEIVNILKHYGAKTRKEIN